MNETRGLCVQGGNLVREVLLITRHPGGEWQHPLGSQRGVREAPPEW